MPSSSKAKLYMALTTGGAVAVGTPVVLNYSRGESTQISIPKEDSTESSPVSITENEGHAQITKLEVRDSSLSIEEKNKSFEEFWSNITSNYQKHQNENKEVSENTPSFQSQLKDILLKESESNGRWLITKEEYKDCSRISGGKTDYCGYLQVSMGRNEYRLKFDRYGKGGNNKKWDVTVVKKIGDNSVQWYSSRRNNWETKNTGINSFQGDSQSSSNWWSTLQQKSIEV